MCLAKSTFVNAVGFGLTGCIEAARRKANRHDSQEPEIHKL
jgi:hypothetical protein